MCLVFNKRIWDKSYYYLPFKRNEHRTERYLKLNTFALNVESQVWIKWTPPSHASRSWAASPRAKEKDPGDYRLKNLKPCAKRNLFFLLNWLSYIFWYSNGKLRQPPNYIVQRIKIKSKKINFIKVNQNKNI